jgi:hypothetical protein
MKVANAEDYEEIHQEADCLAISSLAQFQEFCYGVDPTYLTSFVPVGGEEQRHRGVA